MQTLVLQLDPAYGRRAPAERQRLALAWQQAGAALGLERLELRDGRGRLLGRDALVGEGLVLLEPQPWGRWPPGGRMAPPPP